ncbi:hypothetical protein SSCG_02625 [Streptomyces clavuligerus]|nr:hypothetical protein SSCG_02625 [Streptomyces clavuligerus]
MSRTLRATCALAIAAAAVGLGTLGPQDPTWDSSPGSVVASVQAGGVGDAADADRAASTEGAAA